MRNFFAALVLMLSFITANAANGPIYLADYDGVGDGVTDNKAAFDNAIMAVCASSDTRVLDIGVGKYAFPYSTYLENYL